MLGVGPGNAKLSHKERSKRCWLDYTGCLIIVRRTLTHDEFFLMARRRNEGSETWNRLLNWDRGQAASERLAGHILRSEGFGSLDPIHPLGGRDRLKDIVCFREGKKWVAAAYFPRSEKRFGAAKSKFTKDLAGVQKNKASGFVFVTNQPLSESSREKLKQSAQGTQVDIYHLERIVSILDSAPLYGVRLEFLDIEMTKDEQLAFFAHRDKLLEKLGAQLDRLTPFLEAFETGDVGKLKKLQESVPLEDLREFRSTLASITGWETGAVLGFGPHIQNLRVPLSELKEFVSILRQISGFDFSALTVLGPQVTNLRVPLDDLRQFKDLLEQLTSFSGLHLGGTMQGLRVPLEELREYERTLDRVLDKMGRLESVSQPKQDGGT